MTASACASPSHARQRGVSLIAGIFLLLLMAALAAVMVNLVSTAHFNTAADIGGARAYQAARAGAEWGMYQLDPNAQSAALVPCFADANPPIPDHRVDVKCSNSDHAEAGRQIRIYRIISVATAIGARAPGIERQIEVTIEKCRDPVNVTVAPFDC